MIIALPRGRLKWRIIHTIKETPAKRVHMINFLYTRFLNIITFIAFHRTTFEILSVCSIF